MKIENFSNKIKNNIFLTGWEYRDYIENKDEKNRLWYEKIYLWYYYNCFYIILIIGLMLIIFIALGEFDNNSLKNKNSKNKNNSKNYKNNNNYKKSQQGGADKNTGNYNQINNETQSKLRNIKNTEIQAELNAKEKMEKGNRGERTVKNIKSGYDFNPADKVLSKERQRRLKLGSDRMKKGFKQGIGPLYKYIFSIFIFVAFGMFILPTIVMFFISAITFFITKNQIQKVLTN
tara:strand:- start:223 stop:921 length:699 start_codon:yes stop_codon:yes gene_type:complete